jgi:hypothetical protein
MSSTATVDPIDGQWWQFSRSAWQLQEALGNIARLSRERGDGATEVWASDYQNKIMDNLAAFIARSPDATELFVCAIADRLEVEAPLAAAPTAAARASARQVVAWWVMRLLGAAVYPCSIFSTWWWRTFDERTALGKVPLVLSIAMAKTGEGVRWLGGIPKIRPRTIDELRAEGSIPAD